VRLGWVGKPGREEMIQTVNDGRWSARKEQNVVRAKIGTPWWRWVRLPIKVGEKKYSKKTKGMKNVPNMKSNPKNKKTNTISYKRPPTTRSVEKGKAST
jgi:hypothetical protein